jgi:hypothetical protein
VQRIGNVKKTTIQITAQQNEWAKRQAKRIKLQGGLGAYIRFLIDQDIRASCRYRDPDA